MAAPVASYVQLPSDTGNTGKKVRTQTRVVGADTVHEHFFIPISQRSKLGLYHFSSGKLTVQASAHNGTTTGFLWWVNAAGSGVKAALRRLNIQTNFVTSLSTPTAPRLLFTRFTATGTPSGAQITPAKRGSSDAANVTTLRTASTGLTVTLVADVFATLPAVTAGTAGLMFMAPTQQEMVPQDEDGYPILLAGEGIVGYQPDAGTASDTRVWVVNGSFEEFE
jgi:hypothetical protein